VWSGPGKDLKSRWVVRSRARDTDRKCLIRIEYHLTCQILFFHSFAWRINNRERSNLTNL
jgi:hypothetical protein